MLADSPPGLVEDGNGGDAEGEGRQVGSDDGAHQLRHRKQFRLLNDLYVHLANDRIVLSLEATRSPRRNSQFLGDLERFAVVLHPRTAASFRSWQLEKFFWNGVGSRSDVSPPRGSVL